MGYYVELTPEEKEQRRLEKEILTQKLLKQRKISARLFLADILSVWLIIIQQL